MNFGKVKRYLFRQYMFIKLSGPYNSSDHAIIPFEIQTTFSLGLDNGVGHIYGALPDIAFKYIEGSVQMHECEFIPNKYKTKKGRKG